MPGNFTYWIRIWQISPLKGKLWCGDEGVGVIHYTDVIMSTIASQINSLTIVCSTVYSDAHQRNYQSSASLAFVRGLHRRPVNSPHKWPVTRKMFPFDVVIMIYFDEVFLWRNIWCKSANCVPLRSYVCFDTDITYAWHRACIMNIVCSLRLGKIYMMVSHPN